MMTEAQLQEFDKLCKHVFFQCHLERYQEAEEHARAIIKLLPNHHTGYCRLGAVFAKQEKFQEANLQYHAALERDQSAICALLGLAHVASAQQKHEQAIEWRKKALTLEPTVYGLAMALAHEQLKARRVSDAIETVRLGLREHPNDPNLRLAWKHLKQVRVDATPQQLEAAGAAALREDFSGFWRDPLHHTTMIAPEKDPLGARALKKRNVPRGSTITRINARLKKRYTNRLQRFYLRWRYWRTVPVFPPVNLFAHLAVFLIAQSIYRQKVFSAFGYSQIAEALADSVVVLLACPLYFVMPFALWYAGLRGMYGGKLDRYSAAYLGQQALLMMLGCGILAAFPWHRAVENVMLGFVLFTAPVPLTYLRLGLYWKNLKKSSKTLIRAVLLFAALLLVTRLILALGYRWQTLYAALRVPYFLLLGLFHWKHPVGIYGLEPSEEFEYDFER